MSTLALMVGSFVGFIAAYNLYGRFIGSKIFKVNPDAPVPSKELEDGVDYVPSRRGIIFGHHFTSIAGTGPIVGPAIGIIWGWVPAVLWVIFGSIFIGAVHDFGTLIVSMRNQGKSVSEIASKYINSRVRFIFFFIVFLALYLVFALLIIIAIFGVVIAVVFRFFPSSVIPVWAQIPIAVALGWAVYKKKTKVWVATAVAVFVMYLFIVLGGVLQVKFPNLTAMPDLDWMPATGIWTIILLIYAFIASTLPVTTLLQPRDYTNAWQLFIMMGLLVLGVVAATFSEGGLDLVAPAINRASTGAPSMWPFMFVTIACGAVSGFHSLVASGTSPKQISNERDCLMIGYGAMLLEGALAILILVCVGAGIGIAYTTGEGEVLTGFSAWSKHYASWFGASGLGAKLQAVVYGAANMMETAHIPMAIGKVLMGVFIASFAGTTLDTAVRLQRYITSELASDLKLKPLQNKWSATTFAVVTAAGLAFFTGADGQGAMVLWPLFGAINQLLAALAFLVITMYLRNTKGWGFLISAIPCVFMLCVTTWALVMKTADFYKQKDMLLMGVAGVIMILSLWIFVETVLVFVHKKPVHEA